MRTLLLANGERPSADLLNRLAADSDFILVTDGAAHYAAEVGIVPDVVCGDFDSIHLAEAQAVLPATEFLTTPSQELGDLEKAVLLALEKSATRLVITGAGGGRTDHFLTNYALLLRYHTEVPLSIVDDRSQCWAVSGTAENPGDLAFPACPGDTVSLVSFSGTSQVSIAGVKWPLDNYRLTTGTQGVSNVAVDLRVTVRIVGSPVFVCHLPL